MKFLHVGLLEGGAPLAAAAQVLKAGDGVVQVEELGVASSDLVAELLGEHPDEVDLA